MLSDEHLTFISFLTQDHGRRVSKQQSIPPIFVIDGLDVGVFKSIEEAVLQLEPLDVDRGEYSAYDAQGRLLKLVVDGARVTAQLAESEASHARELSALLREFLEAMGELNETDPECDLRYLVDASRRFIYSSPKFWQFRK